MGRVQGVVGLMVDGLPERMAAFSSGGHCGSVATVCTPLGCASVHSGKEKGVRGVLWGFTLLVLGP